MHKPLYTRPNEIYITLLRDTRQARGLRQSDLAILLGRSQGIVSRVESGERRLDLVELWAWLKALDVDLVSFVQQLDCRLSSALADPSGRGQTVPRSGRSTNS